MNEDMFMIQVPGSTANLGPGFDSVGLAIDRYLTLTVKPSHEWAFTSQSKELEGIPTGKDNLMYQVAAKVAEEYGALLPTCHVDVTSSIPMSRGLGSSAAAIVAGIELADHLLDLRMEKDEKARWASLHETHPDNVSASVYGGLVIGHHDSEATDVILGGAPSLDIIAVIPDYELKTDLSRTLLPDNLTHGEAVRASSVSNVLVASLLQGKWEIAGKMMEQDLFHQSYRMEAVPELKTAKSVRSMLNVYGMALSGAGPIVLFFAPEGEGSNVKHQLSAYYPDHDIQQLSVDCAGAKVEKVVTSSSV
ncbi:homoserine kinase [Texcoconibacillus texcoconensis]|uniref:Homoserine kinase n=1 Tax=Texcoconibacillus texcoconensis TaxID=1095777 RepID=A0A840QS61_9BACI|nr:homoserine kinase [Texcoconibacillus texcoconensis]MBB5174180.1 homoserine kinase [Texcoconibacillus texcoconensis]